MPRPPAAALHSTACAARELSAAAVAVHLPYVALCCDSACVPQPPVLCRVPCCVDSTPQERASKQLPGPGQHFSFGALQPWETIHQLLELLPSEWSEAGALTC